MKLEEIKQAVRGGKTVHWANKGYVVKLYVDKDVEYWNIVCSWNNHCIGLTNVDETELNGNEEEFFIADDKENSQG